MIFPPAPDPGAPYPPPPGQGVSPRGVRGDRARHLLEQGLRANYGE